MSVFITRRGTTTMNGTTPEPIVTVDPVFANNTWDAIIEACQANAVPSSWAVGDYRPMAIGNDAYFVVIIGKNHDVYSDGTGIAPLTFQVYDAYGNTTYIMHDVASNSGSWEESQMRTFNLPNILATMPIEVKTGIREVNKLTSVGQNLVEINTTADNLFLPSEVEVFGVTTYSVQGEGQQYEFYKDGNRIKSANGNAVKWWLRSPQNTSMNNYCAVNTSGYPTYDTAIQDLHISFAFCF